MHTQIFKKENINKIKKKKKSNSDPPHPDFSSDLESETRFNFEVESSSEENRARPIGNDFVSEENRDRRIDFVPLFGGEVHIEKSMESELMGERVSFQLGRLTDRPNGRTGTEPNLLLALNFFCILSSVINSAKSQVQPQ